MRRMRYLDVADLIVFKKLVCRHLRTEFPSDSERIRILSNLDDLRAALDVKDRTAAATANRVEGVWPRGWRGFGS